MPRRRQGATGGTPTRRRSLAILYQQLGHCIAIRKIIRRRFSRTKSWAPRRRRRPARAHDDHGHVRAAKDLTKALAAGKEAAGEISGGSLNTRKACAVAWRERQTEEAVKILRAQLPRE